MHLTMYQKYDQDCQAQLNGIAASCRRISFWRGILFLAAAIFAYLAYKTMDGIFCIPAAAALAVFVLLIQKHQSYKKTQRFLHGFQASAKDYMARSDGQWQCFPNNGAQYLPEKSGIEADLDLFGPNSLYQYICTASSVYGQDCLARWLKDPGWDIAEIQNRQQATAELAKKTAFTANFEAAARQLRDIPYEDAQKSLEHFFAILEDPNRNTGQGRSGAKTALHTAGHLLIWLFPALTLACLCFVILGLFAQAAVSGFMLLATLQLSAAFICYSKNNQILAPIYQMEKTIAPYRQLIGYMEQEAFQSPYLQKLRQSLGQEANTALQELEALAGSVVQRRNLYAFILYNSLFLHDFHCMERYAAWKAKYKRQVRTWLMAIGEIEALISLGVIAHTKETHTIPVIEHARQPKLRAACLKHPLLPEPQAVGNDFTCTSRTCIITGSNMSGKTTFLRSIGVNLALAYAGGFCTAQSLTVSRMELCTSMRIEDNVSAGISTFYAELLRIKHIIECSKGHKPMIALIDEIYKGTNSKDRIAAAKETIRKLSRPSVLTFLTTHDFELCSLENEEAANATNYYFTEHYNGHEILFDYKIHKGQCTTTNAQYLLRMAGILP